MRNITVRADDGPMDDNRCPVCGPVGDRVSSQYCPAHADELLALCARYADSLLAAAKRVEQTAVKAAA